MNDLVLAAPVGVRKTALISDCENYRYRLQRIHIPDGDRVLFVMVNPSTADAEADDATLRRCMNFSRIWGYGGNVELVNLFALRSRDPELLKRHADPVGPENERHLLEAVADRKNRIVVCAWGANGRIKHRDQAVLSLLQQHADLYAIEEPNVMGDFERAFTKNGEPEHPLMLKAASRPFLWLRRAGA